jgi:hypothetical protein
MSKIDFSKLTLAQIASLDFQGDLRVKSRVHAGVTGSVSGGTQGAPPPPPKGKLV